MENDIKFSKPLDVFLAEDKSQYPLTLFPLLEACAAKYGDLPALSKACEPPMPYKELLARVFTISELLTLRGISKGDRIAILGENSPNWIISYFAIVRIGAIAVPILPEFPESDILHILNDSESKILFTTQKQLEKLASLGNNRLTYIMMMDDFNNPSHNDIKLESLSSIFERAIDFLKKIPSSFGFFSRSVDEEDVASIIYTSGTSGNSKAVMLSHKNFIANLAGINTVMDFGTTDAFLSILPLSHSYEFTIGMLLPLINGARIIYLTKPPTPRLLEEVCKVEKPTAICSVPLIMEKIYKKKVSAALEKNMAIKLIAKIPGVKHKIYKKINRKLLEFFGGQLRIMAIGGAAINSEAETFFRAAGFPYLIGYGLTETAPLLAGGPLLDKTIKVTSTGKVCPCCQLKIHHPDPKTGIGEIYAQGFNVMKGYYKNPELTAQAFDAEGWFKTGDLGYFDKYDNLYIKGRSKNMILLSNGENIYPEAIEEKLNSCFHVLESLVLENNNLLEAWVYLDYELIDDKTKGKSDPQRREYIEEVLTQIKVEVNQQLSSFAKLARIIEQKEPFVKTATHKIKRYLYTHPEKKGKK